MRPRTAKARKRQKDYLAALIWRFGVLAVDLPSLQNGAVVLSQRLTIDFTLGLKIAGPDAAVDFVKSGEAVSSDSSGKVRFYYQGIDGGSGEEMELEILLTVESKIVPR